MPGVYVATPEADTTPDVPPGWGGWPFPGPYPPGYVPSLSMVLNTPPQMKPGVPVRNNSVTLYDYSTFPSNQPTGIVTYTAVWSNPGETIQLRFSGVGGFTDSVSESYGDIGSNFWGTTPEFEFNVTDSDIGKTIILTARSVPFDGGEMFAETSNILVVAKKEYTSTLTVVATYNDFPAESAPPYSTYLWGMYMYCWDQDAGFGPYVETLMSSGQNVGNQAWSISSNVNSNDPESQNGLLDFGIEAQEDDGDDWFIGLTDEGTNRIHWLRFLEDQLYDVSLEFLASWLGGGSITYTFTLVVSMDGEEQETVTKVVTIDSAAHPAGNSIGEEIWCTLNGETGEITIINP